MYNLLTLIKSLLSKSHNSLQRLDNVLIVSFGSLSNQCERRSVGKNLNDSGNVIIVSIILGCVKSLNIRVIPPNASMNLDGLSDISSNNFGIAVSNSFLGYSAFNNCHNNSCS